MFTLDQIQQAHARVKSGIDFPKYIQDLIRLGVKHYETFVADGHTAFYGAGKFTLKSNPKYAPLTIRDTCNREQFQHDLREHQQGNTDYVTFSTSCASLGVSKWRVDVDAMTCTYYDRAENVVLVEHIPGASGEISSVE